jgi:hypothetical protein
MWCVSTSSADLQRRGNAAHAELQVLRAAVAERERLRSVVADERARLEKIRAQEKLQNLRSEIESLRCGRCHPLLRSVAPMCCGVHAHAGALSDKTIGCMHSLSVCLSVSCLQCGSWSA